MLCVKVDILKCTVEANLCVCIGEGVVWIVKHLCMYVQSRWMGWMDVLDCVGMTVDLHIWNKINANN